MKKVLFGFLFLAFSNFAIADHHALNLEARQPRSNLEITSIQIGEDLSVITAEGASVEYGKVYVTYYLSYDRDGSGGSYTVQGRGFVDTNTLFSASGAGRWLRDGHLVRMSGVVSISDGSQNIDVIVIDPLNRMLTVDVYGLSNQLPIAKAVQMLWEEFSEVLGDLTIRVRDKVEKLPEVKI